MPAIQLFHFSGSIDTQSQNADATCNPLYDDPNICFPEPNPFNSVTIVEQVTKDLITQAEKGDQQAINALNIIASHGYNETAIVWVATHTVTSDNNYIPNSTMALQDQVVNDIINRANSGDTLAQNALYQIALGGNQYAIAWVNNHPKTGITSTLPSGGTVPVTGSTPSPGAIASGSTGSNSSTPSPSVLSKLTVTNNELIIGGIFVLVIIAMIIMIIKLNKKKKSND